MSKAYSNKALPPGTVLREWRLEEVLGVGGFGIVYKGRGIYFDELVAIKEYFPSAISDRKEGDTVVPIDSEAEEVHALGLKKFVEEAKLLWNLSTPSRHPNIVSVRSLFEIHGTAYMVMDFEDGTSLSKLLKEGRRFNEASLLALLQPIAEGLERAHRVGVLHRDIKPANILVNADGRPVLIDFGSARFESAEATSTKVTFHTPPYAAIEQYVKTYDQGPWTDVYALGVVLFECITGEKPPEVLERLHGGLGGPLADRECPGYSRKFLQAVDAAMTIRPSERPQSISDWLTLLKAPDEDPAAEADEDVDDEATRFVAFDTLTHKIVPVAPPPPGFDRIDRIDTGVPEEVGDAQFKGPGNITASGTKLSGEADPVIAPAAAEEAQPAASVPVRSGSTSPLVLAGAAALLAAVAGGGAWFLWGSGSMEQGSAAAPDASGGAIAGDALPSGIPAASAGAGAMTGALQSLAAEARKANAPAAAVERLAAAGSRLAGLSEAGLSETGQGGPEIASLVVQAAAGFAGDLKADVERRSLSLAAQHPWADPRRSGAAAGEGVERQRTQARLVQARSALAAQAAALAGIADPVRAVAGARQALADWRSFASYQYRAKIMAPSDKTPEAAETGADGAQAGATTPAAEESGARASAKARELAAIVTECRGIANQVIAMGRSARASSAASDKERQNARMLQQNVTSAQGYLTYLGTLTSSMRNVKSDREAERLVSQAEQTRRYLLVLLSRSSSAAK